MINICNIFLGLVGKYRFTLTFNYVFFTCIICLCCTSCRSGTRQVRSVSGGAWWSTITAASMPSSSCTTWPASAPSRASPSGLRSAADTVWGPWCPASWWATSVTWGTAGRSPPPPPSVSPTATTSHCLKLQPRILLRRNMLTPSFWLWLIDWRATNPWDWSSPVRAISGSCGTRKSRKHQLVNAKVLYRWSERVIRIRLLRKSLLWSLG